MKEHPLIFTTELIPKILDLSKTQTRRILKPQPEWSGTLWFWKETAWDISKVQVSDLSPLDKCPYGQVGDRLWVRETWKHLPDIETSNPDAPNPKLWYLADFNTKHNFCYPWKSPLFMPRWASRITLEITGIRVERLQEINRADVRQEGIKCRHCKGYTDNITGCTCIQLFSQSWDSLNAKRGHPWSNNDWVWVIDFKKL